jgi:hypothetical protein
LLLGLGLPEWVTIVLLLGGLWLTFWLMARASVAYEEARRRREKQRGDATLSDDPERR